MSDKFTPLHYKAAFIIINYYRRYKRRKKSKFQRADSIRHLLEDKINEYEDSEIGFIKDKKGDRFVSVVIKHTNQHLKTSKINHLLKDSLTVIDEDDGILANRSSYKDDNSSLLEEPKFQSCSNKNTLQPDIIVKK